MHAQEHAHVHFFDLRQTEIGMNALGLGLVAAVCWGLHDITIRYLSRSVSLLAALLIVLIVGTVFQAGAVALLMPDVDLSGLTLWLSIAAGAAFLVASLGLYFAFERGPVRLVAPLIASYPILSVGFALLGGSSITIAQGMAVLAIVAGVGLVAALSNDSAEEARPIGPTILLSLIAAAGFASTFKLGHMAAEMAGELPTTLVARLTALIALIAVISARKAPFFPGKAALLPLAIMGFLNGIALLCVISAARLPHPEYAAVAASTFGLLTIVMAWVFLREKMTPPQWAGCLLAFGGIAYLAL